MRSQVDKMLSSMPPNFTFASSAQIQLVQKLLPLTSWQLEKYTNAVDKYFTLIDPIESEYLDGWVDERGDKHEGMRSRETKKRNGIWRFVTSEHGINEGSSKYGLAHGLVREIS